MLVLALLIEVSAGLMEIPFDGAPGVVAPASLGEGHLRLVGGWSELSSATRMRNLDDPSRNGSDSRIGSVELAMGWGVSTWTDLGVSGAYHFESGLPLRESDQSGFGDTWIHLRQHIPLDALTGPVKVSLRGRLGLPTGERGKGVWPRELFSQPAGDRSDTDGTTAFGGAGASWGASVGAGLDLSSWNVPVEFFGEGAIDASTASRRDAQIGSGFGFQASPTPFPLQVLGSIRWIAPLHRNESSSPSRLRVSAGGMVRPRPWFAVQGEFWGSLGSRDPHPVQFLSGPSEAPVHLELPGDAPAGFALRVALDFSAPDPDSDHDGNPDRLDRCPSEPEDHDGFEDSDGCPDPDNDRDGVCDPWVSAAGGLVAGRWGSICRGIDLCPDAKEDIDGFEDRDGCPDPDNDGDGICDPWVSASGLGQVFAARCSGIDRCPDTKEDFDGFEDSDGCPDPDNDKDGVPDTRDACPDQGYSDSVSIGPDGCPVFSAPAPVPQASPAKDSIASARWVLYFAAGSDALDSISLGVLDSVAIQLARSKANPVAVEGHTDSRGEAEWNQDLSERRARRVVEALVDRGIPPTRLVARGRGFSCPATLNFEDQGRASNRRCEIRLGGDAP